MDGDGRLYCIDSSSLIAAWHERYRPENFGSFWSNLEGLIEAGALISSEEVLAEVSARDGGLADWAKGQGEFFLPLDMDQQLALRDILVKRQLLTKDFRGRNRADPYVIALAKVRGAVVVTEENPGSDSRPKIPDTCEQQGIECIKLADLIAEQGWKF